MIQTALGVDESGEEQNSPLAILYDPVPLVPLLFYAL